MSAASPPIRYDSNHSLVVSLDTPSRRASDLAPDPIANQPDDDSHILDIV